MNFEKEKNTNVIQTGSISAKIKCFSGSGVKPFTVRYSDAVPSICGNVITIGPPKLY